MDKEEKVAPSSAARITRPHSLTIRVSERDMLLLKLAANRAGLSQADVVHIALEEYGGKRGLTVEAPGA